MTTATKRETTKKSKVTPLAPKTVDQHRLSEIAVMARLSISIWRAQRTDKKITQEVAESRHNNKRMGKYNKFLIGEDVLSDIEKAAGEAYIMHRELTLPWTDEGFRLLSSAGYLVYKQRMSECENKYWAGVRAFLPKYPQHCKDAKDSLNGDFNPLEYPAVNEIERKFGFRLNIGPVPNYEDWRVNIGDDEVKRLRQEGKSFLEEQLKISTQDIYRRLRVVIKNMAERLKAYTVTKDGKRDHCFRDTLVSNISEVLEIIPILNVTSDPDVTAFAQQIRTQLTIHDPEKLRSDEKARKDVQKRAEEIMARMSSYLS